MFRNVLVPVDGSPLGEHAIPWAVAAAGEGGAVHLVHVHETAPPLLMEGIVVSDPRADVELMRSEGGYLDTLAGRVRAAAPGVTVTARNLDTLDPLTDALAAAIEDVSAELVAITTHGRGPFARFWLGSVTDDLIRASPVPVLIGRPAGATPADFTARPTLRRLVVPLDGSEVSEAILSAAVRLGQAFGAELDLLLVLDALENINDIARVRETGLPETVSPVSPAERAREYLDLAARVVAGHGVAARTEFIVHGAAADAIVQAAGGDPASGVAMATHSRSGVARLFFGSVTDDVIRRVAGPVLAFHPAT